MTQFKPLALSDIETIVILMQQFYAIDNYPINIDVSKALFQAFISNENFGKSWLILSDNEIVGYILLTFVFSFEYQGKIAFLDELYLTEKARGKGIGSKAIAFIQSESHKLSLKLIYLEVEQHNEKAQKLYLAHGFESHNRKLMKYKIK
ncbi:MULTISPECIES: GNAT family N-acetyltransferase [Flavobacterium]|uniref:GNAT family N-acetyltransferase n=1 Tax=Flavobacterium ranwuense TaxID=2541725 RepID=A0ABY2DUW8_9FLAO|nr:MULTISPECIES: GNAT family N-acetyltransferase [Flavobacterium]TDE29662.1 GNAT family N-acetyltransferase [Flavobacterium ranwuense]TDE54145.1 GNAT family N-acetyltransferase [Flavobacterium sp. GT3P67]